MEGLPIITSEVQRSITNINIIQHIKFEIIFYLFTVFIIIYYL